VADGGEVLARLSNRLEHAFPNGDRRHDDDEFGQAIAAGQSQDRAEIDIGFARPRLHFHGEVGEAHIACAFIQFHALFDARQRIVMRQAAFRLHRAEIAQQLAIVQIQPIWHNG